MGSNFANEMASGVLDDLGIHLDLETQIGIHLSSNHYPPVPKFMVPICIEAIDAVNDAGLWDLEIPMPIIEQHHLQAWLIEREEV